MSPCSNASPKGVDRVPRARSSRAASPNLRVEDLRVDELGANVRAALGNALYEIFCESYDALSQETVCDEIVFRDGGWLALYRDAHGTLMGFTTFKVHEIELGGRTHGVIQSGSYFRRGIRGGARATQHAVWLSALERLRHPRRPLWGMFEALTPASYRRGLRTLPHAFPTRRGPTPPHVAELLSAVIERLGLARVGEHPFVVSYPDPAVHRDPERLASSETLRNDPDVRFYLEQNPHFVDGHILCVLAPLGWRDIGGVLLQRPSSSERNLP